MISPGQDPARTKELRRRWLMVIAKPDNEQGRIAALEKYAILDTEPEQSFGDLTLLASFVCKTPIALISLVDEDRQWFKSPVGMDPSETSPEHRTTTRL